jgi:hypothetical protein
MFGLHLGLKVSEKENTSSSNRKETFILGSFQSFIYGQIKIAHCKPKKKRKKN